MNPYKAPVQDWLFNLHDVLGVDRTKLPGFEELTPEFTSDLLHAAAKFHEEVLHPMNLAADQEGARLEDGQVRTPRGYREAWKAYREAGWHAISLSTELGGAGLPPVMSVPVTEAKSSTGHSFGMYGGFCGNVATMLSRLGEPWMVKHVVPKLAAGEWTGTMCMTEPQAGTDLRQLRTRARQEADGTWRISGHKIFISGGDHDLTDNVVHIVLAKVPDENGRLPMSLSAVNVFLVSKRRIDPKTGELGGTNGVRVQSLEHKMGIEGSATCALEFEDAIGWRLASSKRQGTSANMAAMFMLMNFARVGTAMSGIAYSELSRQKAAEYARERLSGRAPRGPRHPELPADPIIVHPDVRRLLLESRAFTEAARAGAMRAAYWQSVAERSEDPAERERIGDLLEVLKPVMKAFFTDRGFEAAVACQQVLGGHGYIKDHGIEQYVRNARIGMIYEGANGIQAVDLVQRKLTANDGRAGRAFIGAIREFAQAHAADPAVEAIARPLGAAADRMERMLEWLRGQSESNPEAVAGGAYDVLNCFGILYLAWNWGLMAAAASRPESRFADETLKLRKRQLGRLWAERQLPLVHALCERIECGNETLVALPDELV